MKDLPKKRKSYLNKDAYEKVDIIGGSTGMDGVPYI